MRELGPGEIAAIVAMLMSLVVWIGALRGAKRWERFQKTRRRSNDFSGGPPSEPDDPNRPRGPWG